MPKRWLALFGSLPLCTLYPATVRIINDSPFELQALVLAATGEVMGRTALQPQGQYSWENSNINTADNSMSPFTVVFHCKTNGGLYGSIGNVTTGSMVQASTASGARYCAPKKQKKGEKPEPPSDLQYGKEPINPELWREQNRY